MLRWRLFAFVVSLILSAIFIFPDSSRAQKKSGESGRILLLPRNIVAGDRATLAVLDVSGRLAPGVTVHFSNGEKYTTDATGRALFVAPLNPGVIFGSLPGRAGRVPTTILTSAEASASSPRVTQAPRIASISDRFELAGNGFCGDADSNQVMMGDKQAIVLASSPVSMTVLAPLEQQNGAVTVKVSCGRQSAPEFSITLVSLELKADSAAMAPGEKRVLTVQVHGSAARVMLEARNLAPEMASLNEKVLVRATSSGGAENIARFELLGKKRGNFLISIRLIPSLFAPKDAAAQ
ncbi:MAG TPA: hypothetical protein VN982_01900 [Candidatus Dormibacteraeota bacterium]|nr:hypothetical protein [Candidatus Dormibacteraeota bacterium]